MKLDDFRRIVLEPDSAKAREMATPQRQKQASSKNTAILAEKVTESPNTAKITNSSVKRVTIVAATKEKSPDKSLLQSRSKQFQLKNETSDVVKSNKSLRISPLKENKESEAVVAETTKLVDESSFFHSVLNKPVIWCSKFVAVCQYLINLPSAILHWCKLQLDYWIFSSPLLPGLVTGSGLLYLASFISMTYPLFALCRLLLGTLYPAYVSYKAVRTKNVREYVKWMMYWIVFAIFTSFETFADVFIAFWFPFYYELKILILLWLISPVSRGSLGSSILYRRFVHPAIMNREEEIDHMILRMQEQGYNTVTRMAGRAFTYVSDFVMQTAIRNAPNIANFLDAVDGRQVRALQRDGEGVQPEQIIREGDLDNLDEIDNMVMDFAVPQAAPAAGPSRKAPRKPRASKKKVKRSEFSSDSADEPSETPASSDIDMDADYDPNVTMARKRRGRKPKKDPSSETAEDDEVEVKKPSKKRATSAKKK